MLQIYLTICFFPKQHNWKKLKKNISAKLIPSKEYDHKYYHSTKRNLKSRSYREEKKYDANTQYDWNEMESIGLQLGIDCNDDFV